MKKVICKLVLTGMDWHDTRSVTEYLKENGSWFVSDPEPLIVKDIFNELSAMRMDTDTDGRITNVTLQDIPSEEEVAGFVKNRKAFTVTSGEATDDALTAEWNPAENVLQMDFAHGQVSTTIQYCLEDIPDEKLCFIPVEVFYAPTKGCYAIQRMRAGLFSLNEEAEAKQAMDDIQNNLWGTDMPFGSAAEMIICNRDTLKEESSKTWYENNLKAFQLRTQHPEIEGYRLFAVDDISFLENEIKKEELG